MNHQQVANEFFAGWDRVESWRDDMKQGLCVRLFISDRTIMDADRDWARRYQELVAKADMDKFARKLTSERNKSGLRFYGRTKK